MAVPRYDLPDQPRIDVADADDQVMYAVQQAANGCQHPADNDEIDQDVDQ